MRRCPRGEAISISASSASSAGAVSPEKTAQQREPPGATWQTSPSFFRQKLQDLRQNRDWLYHKHRVSRHRLPPSVPMVRSTGLAMDAAAAARTGKLLR